MATLTTRRGYWILSWTEGAQRRRQSLGQVSAVPRKDAEACRTAKEYELSTGARLLNANRKPAPRLDYFVRDYLLWHRMEYPSSHYRTAQVLLDHILPRFGLLPMNLIRPGEVEQFKSERRFLAKASTVGKELRVFQAVMNRACKLGLIERNPVAIVKAPRILDSKPHRFYEADELATIYPSPYGEVWRLMANTGVRRTEALLLRRAWIGAESMKILSTEEDRTKSGKWREIPLSDGARIALERLEGTDYVLPRIQPESLSRAFLRDAGRVGLDGSLHTLRHTYVSHLVRAGVPLRTVQMYAGHSSYTTTEKYAYLSPGSAPEAVLRLAI